MADQEKIEQVLKSNLHNLFTVLMALYDTDVNNQVKAPLNFKDIDKIKDYMTLMNAIKKFST